MRGDNQLIDACITKLKDPAVVQVGVEKALRGTWQALSAWSCAQLQASRGASITGLCKFLWHTPVGSSKPCLAFVLADGLVKTHRLQFGPGLTRSAALTELVQGCEEVNCAKLALQYCQGLSKDVVAACLRALLKGIQDAMQTGEGISLDLGPGALTIRGGRAEFAFRGSWASRTTDSSGMQGKVAAGAGGTAAGAAMEAGPCALTVDALQAMDSASQAGVQSGARSTVYKAATRSTVSKAHSHASRTSMAHSAAAGLASTAPHGTAGALGPGQPESQQPIQLLDGRILAAVVMEGRVAAKANARQRPATFVLPVGGEDDEAQVPAPSGKGKCRDAAAPLSYVMEQAAKRQQQAKEQQQRQEERRDEQAVQLREHLNQQAKEILAQRQLKKQQLAATLSQQVQERATLKQTAAATSQGGACLPGLTDPATAAAQRAARQEEYKRALEQQQREKEALRNKGRTSSQQEAARMLEAVQSDIVQAVFERCRTAQQHKQALRQVLDEQISSRVATGSSRATR